VIFKVLPEARVSARDAMFGALVTTVLFSVGTALVGLYVGSKVAESFFGAASSVVMLLLWVNYSAQVFFLGAAFTGVHARLRGDGVHARDDHPPED
jgi:membrane protein